MQNTIFKEFENNPEVVTMIFQEGGQYGETLEWAQTFWSNYYLRTFMMWDPDASVGKQYQQPNTWLPFGRGFVIDREGKVHLPHFGHSPDLVINTIYSLLAEPEGYCTAGTSSSGCQATLSATGTASSTAPSGFDLTATSVEGDKDGLYYFGTNGRQATPWGNGSSFQCVAPPVQRAGLLTGQGTPGACDGTFSQDLNALWAAQPSKNPGAGATVQAQLWYRDPLNTSNQTTSLSDGLEFFVVP